MKDRNLDLVIWALLIGLAFWLRVPHFSPLALQFDEVEYAYCVKTNQFPHSPYLLFLWMGYLMKPFVSLDWGYSALSMVSSLATVFFIGSVAGKLTGSRTAGWMTALVWAIAPIALRVGAKQEVYAFQTCLLTLSWYLAVCHRKVLLSGLALGATFAAHNGTLFALPATLTLFYLVWSEPEKAESEGDNAPMLPVRSAGLWGPFAIGFAAPVLMVLTWIVGVWINFHGTEKLDLLPVYLEGNSPSADFSLILPDEETPLGLEWIKTLRDNVGDQFERFWHDLADTEVIPRGGILFGFLGLLFLSWKRSLPWWLLPTPYLAYEFAVGWTLDPGIYSVYVLPAIAISVGWMTAMLLSPLTEYYHRIVAAICLAGTMLSLLVALPSVQKEAHLRNLEPWRVEKGAMMSLAKWVRDNTPEDSIVDVPAEWFYCGLAIPYYAERLPMFRDGYILRPEKWRPMYSDQRFQHLEKVSDAMIDEWIDSNRPLLSFDPNPFTGFGASWGGIDTGRLEVRPILWLDRNATGTSRFWNEPEVQVSIEPWLIDDKERRPHFYIDEYFPSAEIEAPVYHPTLYRICRKMDPAEPPEWVRNLQEKVPAHQRGAPPVFKGRGILFTGQASFYSPCVEGEDHAVRLRIHTKGQEYALKCEVRYDGDWVSVGEDVEKYVNDPPDLFTDLFYRVPAKYADEENLRFRISPAFGTDFVNLFEVEVARVRPGKEGD
ncbi:MAG: hypothetical protein H6752_12910 [Candidatus Omnitrophica bacterium]|nr:hypothetical protein [Candidatus Omnitrophota bacterium]